MTASSISFLTGPRLSLRPLEKNDLPLLQKWSNDPELRALTGETRPMSAAAAEDYFERIQRDEARVWFVIEVRATGQVIGETGLLRMFPDWRNTDLSIIIGEAEAQEKGYGSEAIRLMLDYAFGALGFHRVSIGVVGFNARALHFYEKNGFRREGVQRDGYFYNHTFSDFVMMSILEDEFRDLQKKLA
jgi:RimJ/RimL family protein N-acetyltransferase